MKTEPPERRAPVPVDVLEIAVAAARAAGIVLRARFGRPQARAGADARAAAADALAGRLARCDRDGLTWLASPLDGAAGFAAGAPTFCVSVACEDAAGTVAGVILDPVRDELFAGVRGGPVRIDGAPAPAPERAALADALIAGGAASATAARARRAAELEQQVFGRARSRLVLGSTALELAWTAAGRIDVCLHERELEPAAIAAGLFLCRRAGLRVHRLEPLRPGLAERLVVAREPLAAELLTRSGPSPHEREDRRRSRLSTRSVTAAMRSLRPG